MANSASSRVDSITNFQWTRAEGDNIIISDLVPDGKIVKIQQKSEVALNEPMLVNLLINPDTNYTAINVTILNQMTL